jgi:hypothetical protein
MTASLLAICRALQSEVRMKDEEIGLLQGPLAARASRRIADKAASRPVRQSVWLAGIAEAQQGCRAADPAAPLQDGQTPDAAEVARAQLPACARCLEQRRR